MSRTRVMTLGAIPAGATMMALDQGAGLPASGGPMPAPYLPGTQGPDWRINRHYPAPSTPQVPQNLQRPTNATITPGARTYSGKDISPMVAGVFTPGVLLGDATLTFSEPQVSVLQVHVARSALLGVVGVTVGVYHGYRRSKGSVGSAIGWGLLGLLFPVITTGVALYQGCGRPK